MKKRHTALAAAGLCLALVPALTAVGPDWWSQYGVLQSGQGGDNYSPVNVGQLKHIATRAKAYFDAELPGGAGSAVNSLVASFGSGPHPENFAPANVGQLKAVASVFYQRLHDEFGFSVAGGLIHWGADASSISQGAPIVPWSEGAGAGNWHPANIGQVKLVFSFDLWFLATAQAAHGQDGDAAGDGFAAFVVFFAGLPDNPFLFQSAQSAAGWHAHPEVTSQMQAPSSQLYIVLPDQGPFVGAAQSQVVEGQTVEIITLH